MLHRKDVQLLQPGLSNIPSPDGSQEVIYNPGHLCWSILAPTQPTILGDRYDHWCIKGTVWRMMDPYLYWLKGPFWTYANVNQSTIVNHLHDQQLPVTQQVQEFLITHSGFLSKSGLLMLSQSFEHDISCQNEVIWFNQMFYKRLATSFCFISIHCFSI